MQGYEYRFIAGGRTVLHECQTWTLALAEANSSSASGALACTGILGVAGVSECSRHVA